MFVSSCCSFAVCLGVVERLSQICQSVRTQIHDNPSSCQFLLGALDLLASLASKCPTEDSADPTHLVSTLHGTELVGVVSMLYGTLLPSGTSPRCRANVDALDGQGDNKYVGEQEANILPDPCLKLATVTFRLLRRVAELDLKKFQVRIRPNVNLTDLVLCVLSCCVVLSTDSDTQRESISGTVARE